MDLSAFETFDVVKFMGAVIGPLLHQTPKQGWKVSENLGEDRDGKKGLGFLCALMALTGTDLCVLPLVWFAAISHSSP